MGKGLPHSLAGAVIRPRAVVETEPTLVKWKGNWEPGEYLPMDMVRDAEWLMVCINQTIDRAAPQVNGPPILGIGLDPTWVTTSEVGTVYSGNQYTFTTEGRLAEIRVWVPVVGAGIENKVFIRNITYGVENSFETEITPVILIAGQWNSIGTNGMLVQAGITLQIFIRTTNKLSQSSFTGTFTRRYNSSQPPSATSWRIDSFYYNKIHISDFSQEGDIATELNSLIVGDTIKFTNNSDTNQWVEYTVSSEVIDNVDYVTLNAEPTNQGPNGQPSIDSVDTMLAKTFAPGTSSYVVVEDYWLTNSLPFAEVSGIYYLERNVIEQPGIGNNLYGIDITFRGGYQSRDWEIASSIPTIN